MGDTCDVLGCSCAAVRACRPGECGREGEVGERGAVAEGLAADGGECGWEDEVGERGTVAEGIVADGGECGREVDVACTSTVAAPGACIANRSAIAARLVPCACPRRAAARGCVQGIDAACWDLHGRARACRAPARDRRALARAAAVRGRRRCRRPP